jgi:hypothetical protein
MNMDSLNKWLTLAANIGVIAGIVFLGIEIRNNNTLAKVASTQEAANLNSDWRMRLASDINLSEIYVAGLNDYHSLSPLDQERFVLVIKAFISITSANANAVNAALVGEGTLRASSNAGGIFATEGFRQWWSEGDRNGVSGLMIDIIDERLSESVPTTETD